MIGVAAMASTVVVDEDVDEVVSNPRLILW